MTGRSKLLVSKGIRLHSLGTQLLNFLALSRYGYTIVERIAMLKSKSIDKHGPNTKKSNTSTDYIL